MANSTHEARIVGALAALGLNATEGKTYVALLRRHPATGYEIASRSNVPRSAIYKVLNKLAEAGVIHQTQEKPQKFVPLPPERLFEVLEARFSGRLDRLKDALRHFDAASADASTWTVRGYEAMIDQARRMIEASRETIYASLWGREATLLQNPLRAATARGVKVALFSFTELPAEVGQVFSYELTPEQLEPYWAHRIILLADRTRLLVGSATQLESNSAIMTDEPALIEMAVSNLVLDLTLFAQRTNVDVSKVLEGLGPPFAPVAELLRKRRQQN